MFVFKSCLILWILVIDSIFCEEPLCLSRYDYDYKMMQKMFDLEQKLKQTMDMVLEQKKLIEAFPKSDENEHSVYTRWGRNICDGDASVFYKGYIAGRKNTETGGGSDNICLPSDPTWLRYKDGVNGARGYVYGSEINSNNDIHENAVNNQDLPCTVCKTPKRTVLMIPGRGTCYDGWTLEYKGYLMTGYHGHKNPKNYVCLDEQPEFIPNGAGNNDENILYYTEARCGSLPCPPYVEGRELACVVCST